MAHYTGARPGVEHRCPLFRLYVATKKPGCNCRGRVPIAQYPSIVILCPAVVEFRELLSVFGFGRCVRIVRALRMLGPVGIAHPIPPFYSWMCLSAQPTRLKHSLMQLTLWWQFPQRLQM